MKYLTLEEIHKEETEILKKFISFCLLYMWGDFTGGN